MPTDPFGPFYHIASDMGFDAWPTTSITPGDNTCVGCHRIGIDKTCGQITNWLIGHVHPKGANQIAKLFSFSHGMLIEQTLTMNACEAIHGESVTEIQSCCDSPEQAICHPDEIRSYTDQ